MSSLAASLIFGTIGMFLLREAKKRLNYTWVIISAALMFYPWFTQGIWDWLVGGVLLIAAYFTKDAY